MVFAIILAVLVVIVGVLFIVIKFFKLENQYFIAKEAVVRFLRKVFSCIFMTIRMVAIAVARFFVAVYRFFKKIFTRKPRDKENKAEITPAPDKQKRQKEEKKDKDSLFSKKKEVSTSRPVLLPPDKTETSQPALDKGKSEEIETEKILNTEPAIEPAKEIEQEDLFEEEPEIEELEKITEPNSSQMMEKNMLDSLYSRLDTSKYGELSSYEDLRRHSDMSSYTDLRRQDDISRYSDLSRYADLSKYKDIDKFADLDKYNDISNFDAINKHHDIDTDYDDDAHPESLYTMEEMAQLRQEALLREQRRALRSYEGDNQRLTNHSIDFEDEKRALDERSRAMQEALMGIRREQELDEQDEHKSMFSPLNRNDEEIDRRALFDLEKNTPRAGTQIHSLPHFSLKPTEPKETKEPHKPNIKDFMGKSFFSPKKKEIDKTAEEPKAQNESISVDSIDLNSLPENIKKEIIRKYFANNDSKE